MKRGRTLGLFFGRVFERCTGGEMNLPNFFRFRVVASLCFAAQISCNTEFVPAKSNYNSIENGGAETSAGSTDGAPVTISTWTSVGEANVVEYGTPGFLTADDLGPSDRGSNFFAGGHNDAVSTLTQNVALYSNESLIDEGKLSYSLSGWLGGYEDQNDSVVVTATFQNASGSAITVATIGPVTADDRKNVSGLLLRSVGGSVPAETRYVEIIMTMTRTDGTTNDGYADNLSLVLNLK